jgi:hypothetical protein
VAREFGLASRSGPIGVCRSTRSDQIKALLWSGGGPATVCRRLEEGDFACPALRDGAMRLLRGRLKALKGGADWRWAHGQFADFWGLLHSLETFWRLLGPSVVKRALGAARMSYPLPWAICCGYGHAQ